MARAPSIGRTAIAAKIRNALALVRPLEGVAGIEIRVHLGDAIVNGESCPSGPVTMSQYQCASRTGVSSFRELPHGLGVAGQLSLQDRVRVACDERAQPLRHLLRAQVARAVEGDGGP